MLVFVELSSFGNVCNKCKKLNDAQSQIDIRQIKVLVNLPFYHTV